MLTGLSSLKQKSRQTLPPCKGTGSWRDSIMKRQLSSVLPEHLCARHSREEGCGKCRGQVSWLKAQQLGPSQWRDRAGLSPASLFSPQKREAPGHFKVNNFD